MSESNNTAKNMSKAIQDGVDTLISLIDEETEKRTIRLEEELNQVRTESVKHREKSAQMESDLKKQLRIAQGALEKAEADASRAKDELAGAQKSLAQIKATLEEIGVSFKETDGVDGIGSRLVFFKVPTGPSGPASPTRGQQDTQLTLQSIQTLANN